MPRKITIKDLKNKRDYNAWKIELEDHKMADTHAKHDAAVAELARREGHSTLFEIIDELESELSNISSASEVSET